jgi:UDP-3-O-[3-hydroxymyristoyl] glucosamine N-acyltransferase
MTDPFFFSPVCAPTIGDIVGWTGASVAPDVDLAATVTSVAPLEQGLPGHLVFLDNAKYAAALTTTRATACLVSARYAAQTPKGTIALVTPEPYRAFGLVMQRMYPDALRPQTAFGVRGVAPGAVVHAEARLEQNVSIDPGAVVGPGAEIGENTMIGANAVIGAGVRIGRDCSIGPCASIQCALIGDRVIDHPGARVGQDGFGFAMGPRGHLKIPQIGRVIIQNDVEIGANATIDRGASRDTIIGEGAKIDNLVQIGHNVTIGRHCVIVSQSGISGSTEVGDFVAIGGQGGLTGHLRIGAGAQIAAQSGVMRDVPAGERWGGSPAQPMRGWLRGVAALEKLAGPAREPAPGAGGKTEKD